MVSRYLSLVRLGVRTLWTLDNSRALGFGLFHSQEISEDGFWIFGTDVLSCVCLKCPVSLSTGVGFLEYFNL